MTEIPLTGNIFFAILFVAILIAVKIGISETIRWQKGDKEITKVQVGLRILTSIILVLLIGCFIVGIFVSGWWKLISFIAALFLALFLVPLALLDMREVKRKLRQQQQELLQALTKVSGVVKATFGSNSHLN